MNVVSNWLTAAALAVCLALAGSVYGNDNMRAVDGVLTVNVNSADAELIAELLDGIGLRRAESIVAYRDAHGAFQSVEDLAKVKGVGVATVERNRERIALK